MKLNQQPPTIHPLFNPVVFAFESSKPIEQITLTTADNNPQEFAKINVIFDDGEAAVDVSNYIKSILKIKLSSTTTLPFVDDNLYLRYNMHYTDEADTFQSVGVFTALCGVTQIKQSHDFSNIPDKLLTGFPKIIAYNNYPRDVCTLVGAKGKWRGIRLTPDKIHRLPVDCADSAVEVDKSTQEYCTAEWGDFVCQTEQLSENMMYLHYGSPNPMADEIDVNVMATYPVESNLEIEVKVVDKFDSSLTKLVIPKGGKMSNPTRIRLNCPPVVNVSASMIQPSYDDFYIYKISGQSMGLAPSPRNTGKAFASTLRYIKYNDYLPVQDVTKSLLYDASPYVTSSQYRGLSEYDVLQRASALLANVGACADFEVLNNPVKEDIDSCPLPFIFVSVDGKETDNAVLKKGGTVVRVNASGSWQAAYDTTKLRLNMNKAYGNTDILIFPDTGYESNDCSSQIVFSLLGAPQVQTVLNIVDNFVTVALLTDATISNAKAIVIYRVGKEGQIIYSNSIDTAQGHHTHSIPARLTDGATLLQVSEEGHTYNGTAFNKYNAHLNLRSISAGLTLNTDNPQYEGNLYFDINSNFGAQPELAAMELTHK